MSDHLTTGAAAPYVRPDARAMLDMMAASGQPTIDQVEPAVGRQMYGAMRPLLDAEPTPLARVEDHGFKGPGGTVKLRLYDAQKTRGVGPVILFFHGGGFVIGDLESHHPFCTELAAKVNLPVVAVDYRLAPEAPFPAAPDDCEAAARWVAGHGRDLGLDIDGLITCGDSAGGNLAIVVAQRLLAEPEGGAPLIAQFPIYPVTQADATGGSLDEFADGYLLTRAGMDYFHRHYAGDVADPRASPHLGDPAAMVPTVVVTASLDPLRDQGRAYAAALAQAGVTTSFYEARGVVHGFICLRKGIPSVEADLAAIFDLYAATIKLVRRSD